MSEPSASKRSRSTSEPEYHHDFALDKTCIKLVQKYNYGTFSVEAVTNGEKYGNYLLEGLLNFKSFDLFMQSDKYNSFDIVVMNNMYTETNNIFNIISAIDHLGAFNDQTNTVELTEAGIYFNKRLMVYGIQINFYRESDCSIKDNNCAHIGIHIEKIGKQYDE